MKNLRQPKKQQQRTDDKRTMVQITDQSVSGERKAVSPSSQATIEDIVVSETASNSSVASASSTRPMSTRRSKSSRRCSLPKNHSKHFVEHNYHDHIRDPLQNEPTTTRLVAEPADILSKKKRRGHRGGVAVPFPEKLHYMLSCMDEEETADVVNWRPHGRCFTVHKPKEFVEDIMPRYVHSSSNQGSFKYDNTTGFFLILISHAVLSYVGSFVKVNSLLFSVN
jgi:hypothetical protein